MTSERVKAQPLGNKNRARSRHNLVLASIDEWLIEGAKETEAEKAAKGSAGQPSADDLFGELDEFLSGDAPPPAATPPPAASADTATTSAAPPPPPPAAPAPPPAPPKPTEATAAPTPAPAPAPADGAAPATPVQQPLSLLDALDVRASPPRGAP